MRRSWALGIACLFILSGNKPAGAASPVALNGALYGIVEAANDGASAGAASYVRFFNGAAATSTFSVRIVGSQSGLAYGQSVSLQIPQNASVQYSLAQLLTLAGSSAGSGSANGDTSFSVYIQDPDAGVGYQHVTYNAATQAFENASVCNNGLLAASTLARSASVVVPNVHTSSLANNAFPSTVAFHNYSSASATYTVTLYDAGVLGSDGKTISTGAGASLGQTSLTIPANSTLAKLATDLQTAVKWQPTSSQVYANIAVTSPTVGAPPAIVVDHLVSLGAIGSSANMSTACAVNNPSSSTVYAGTIAGQSMQSGTFLATVQPAASSGLATQSSVERTQSVERPQSVSQTSATLIVGGSTVTLTGTANSSSNAITLSGGGYAFTGTVASGVYAGTYTGPNNASGAFATLATTQGAVTAYCGTYSETRQPAGQTQTTGAGVINLQVAANGAVSGDTTPVAGDTEAGTLTGQANGSALTVVHHSSDGDPANDTTVTANVVNGAISGSFTTNGGMGTFSGSTCALPSS